MEMRRSSVSLYPTLYCSTHAVRPLSQTSPLTPPPAPSVVPGSCPPTHCVCHSTAPTPWPTETFPPLTGTDPANGQPTITWAAWTATLSDQVQLYTTAPDGGCANINEQEAGPAIYLVAPTEGTCPPVSTISVSSNLDGEQRQGGEPPVVHLSDLPTLPEGSNPCTILGTPPNILCQCLSFLGELPSPITPGQQCGPDGKSTFSYACSTRLIKPWDYVPTSTVGRQIIATSEAGDFEGCVCAEPSLGWEGGEGYLVGEAHVMQPVLSPLFLFPLPPSYPDNTNSLPLRLRSHRYHQYP